MNLKSFYSVPEAAELLCVSKPKIFLMLKNQELGYMKVGHRTIIPKIAIDDFMNKHYKKAKK
jgi:excisionase family DNA binding protein